MFDEATRDRVRLRIPRILALYQRWIGPRITGDRTHIEFAQWVTRGAEFVKEFGIVGIRLDGGAWIEDASGFLWYYQGGLWGSGTWAEHGQECERAETTLLAALLPTGGTMVDIGANVGLHSIKLARWVQGARILAFEPVGATIECLKRNMRKNGVADRIEVHQVALADHPGEIRVTRGLQLTNFVVPDRAVASQRATERVPCRRLDDVLEAQPDGVDLIKCDVEGSELAVLRGATKTIQRFRPPIFIEIVERYCRRYGHGAAVVFEYLRQHGYSHELIIDGQRRPSTGSVSGDLEAAMNFLFTTRRP